MTMWCHACACSHDIVVCHENLHVHVCVCCYVFTIDPFSHLASLATMHMHGHLNPPMHAQHNYSHQQLTCGC